jgi:hypothetical protein
MSFLEYDVLIKQQVVNESPVDFPAVTGMIKTEKRVSFLVFIIK